jgi:hypothetical protein
MVARQATSQHQLVTGCPKTDSLIRDYKHLAKSATCRLDLDYCISPSVNAKSSFCAPVMCAGIGVEAFHKCHRGLGTRLRADVSIRTHALYGTCRSV